jgi:hypothetical protein
MEDAKPIDRDRLLPGSGGRPRPGVTVAVSEGTGPVTTAATGPAPKGTASDLVKQQADDPALWGNCITFMEDRLQRALRDLHDVVERRDERVADAERIIELYATFQADEQGRAQAFGARLLALMAAYRDRYKAPPPGPDGP